MPPLVSRIPTTNQTFFHLELEVPLELNPMAHEYGPIYRTKSASTDLIWTGCPELFREIIDKRMQYIQVGNHFLCSWKLQVVGGD